MRGRRPKKWPRKPFRYRVIITDMRGRWVFRDFDDINRGPYKALQAIWEYNKKILKRNLTLSDLLHLSHLCQNQTKNGDEKWRKKKKTDIRTLL